MSPRAAARLESLGFEQVFDYVTGKADWIARGLPIEGDLAGIPTVLDATDRAAPTCHLEDRFGDVQGRLKVGESDQCIVVNDENVVLGRVRSESSRNERGATVKDVMEEGPTTFRPDETLHEVLERMAARNVQSLIVTDSDGRLMGIMQRAKAEAVHGGAVHS